MELVADRFILRDCGDAIDLATGRRVEITWSTCGGVSDETRWFARCTELARLRHPAIAPLLDFGVAGEGRRFEAWLSDGEWRGAAAEGDRALDASAGFLAATGRTASRDAGRVRMLDGMAVVIPSDACGYECDRDAAASVHDPALESVGVECLEHGAVTAAGAFLREARGARLRALALWGPRGSGLDRSAQEIACHARIAGFVPLAAVSISEEARALLRRRSICLIVRGEPESGWQQLLDSALSGLRPRVILFIGDRAARGVHTLFLERFSESALIAAIRPAQCGQQQAARIRAAVRQSRGLAGRLIAALSSHGGPGQPRARMRLVRAAERAPAYDAAEPGSSTAAAGGDVPMRVISWPVPADTAMYRQQLDRGLEKIASGRHASGVRACREAIGALFRRQAWDAAWSGSIALAFALRQRGRTAEACALIHEVCPTPERTASEETRILALILSGTLATDMLRLDEAEALLSTAVQVARGLGRHHLASEASIGLARCLFWRGRYDQAERVLGSMDAEPRPEDAIAVAIERSRLAVGRGDFPESIAQADLARRILDAHPSSSLAPRVALAQGFAQLAIGDHHTADASLLAAVRCARIARLPLVALRAQLLQAESLRRQQQTGRAARLLRRILRLPRERLPEVVRARADVLAFHLQDAEADTPLRRVWAAEAPALALFAIPGKPARRATTVDIVDLLRICQVAVDGDRVLHEVAQFVRTRLDAVAIAVFSCESAAAAFVCGDGGRIETAVADRVCTCAQVIAPHPRGAGVEGGAAVRYGGRIIGAIVGRWSLGTSPDPGFAASLLETVAAAIAPALAERRNGGLETAALANPSELLGVSRVMCDLRAAVERAGPAPFSVLIQGESGSGKELVARALHRRSGRREHPCAVINCASLPDELVESELFGHARGAFTGATGDRPGVFEAAHRGTLFLDEVGELSLRAQAKLLRAIQEGEIRRVGENLVRRVDVRLIAATNRDLRAEAEAGRFRADLLYRLDVIRITVPPLRERPDDVVVLAEHVWRDAAGRVGSRAILGAATLAALARYHWPGNVRELQNVLAAVVVRSPRRGVVPPSALPEAFHDRAAIRSQRLDVARREFDARFVQAALARAGGCRAQAARDLGVTRQGLTKLLARLDMTDSARDMVASD